NSCTSGPQLPPDFSIRALQEGGRKGHAIRAVVRAMGELTPSAHRNFRPLIVTSDLPARTPLPLPSAGYRRVAFPIISDSTLSPIIETVSARSCPASTPPDGLITAGVPFPPGTGVIW